MNIRVYIIVYYIYSVLCFTIRSFADPGCEAGCFKRRNMGQCRPLNLDGHGSVLHFDSRWNNEHALPSFNIFHYRSSCKFLIIQT